MAVSKRTLRLLAGMRIQIGKNVDAATRELTRAWATAWNEVAPEWQAAIDELIRIGNDGKWPSRAQVLRAERAARALEVTKAALDDLAKTSGITVTRILPPVVDLTDTIHRQLIASQYPAQAGTQATLTASFARVDAKAAAAIVKRSTQRVTALHRPLSAAATQSMKSSLIRGVLIGENPNRAASRMVARVKGDFDGGLVRAKVIARTEILDAHRAAGLASDQANADVLAGWQWIAELDTRTCPSCWSKHGEVFDVDEAGPLDHQQGRCARLPAIKLWADLGFDDIDEPESLLPDAEQTFRNLPRDDQLAVMGKARLDLLDKGDVTWADLSTKRSTTGWRDSFAPTPVSDLAS
jgi:SPP1 gp7 family putative phage head morphogenesis protein